MGSIHHHRSPPRGLLIPATSVEVALFSSALAGDATPKDPITSPLLMSLKVLGYISPPLAFVTFCLGMYGSTNWDSKVGGLGQITPQGWILIAIGLLAMVTSMFQSWKQNNELAHSEKQRKSVRQIAHDELRMAVRQITWPFFFLWDEDKAEIQFDLRPTSIDDPKKLARVNKIDIRSRGFTGDPYWQTISENAKRGSEQIDRALAIYSGYLEPEVIDSISNLQASFFLSHRLKELGQIVEVNAHVSPLHFYFDREAKIDGYSEFYDFWDRVGELDKLLENNPDRLCKRLGYPKKS
jgi:hypothetical protein